MHALSAPSKSVSLWIPVLL